MMKTRFRVSVLALFAALAATNAVGQTTRQQDAALRIARAYYHSGDLQKAEEAYVVAARMGADASLTAKALNEMDEVRTAERRSWLASAWDKALSLDAAKAVAAVVLLYWLLRGFMSARLRRARIQVVPFIADSDGAARQLVFWVAQARANLRSGAPIRGTVLMVASDLPAADLPGLPSDVPELQDPTLAGTQLPLTALFGACGRPKARVTGGWVGGDAGGRAYAEIELRARSGYTRYALVSRTVSPAGPHQQNDLELFGYDVVRQSADAYGQ